MMDRWTQLPHFIGDDEADPSTHITIQWQVNGPPFPTQVLVLSWATLLRSLTTEENPVFLVNGEPVKADVSARTFQPATLDAIADIAENYTAVILEDRQTSQHPSPDLCTLSWTLNLLTGVGALHSSKGIGTSFLEQIGKQLKQIVRKQAQASGLQSTIPTAEIPDVSIANPSPAILPGPELLHELALGGTKASDHAIEFLNADGTVNCLSYSSLDELSTQLATRIASALVSSGEQQASRAVVPVLLPQSVDLYVSWLAILKAGAAFCPLGIDIPTERIEIILNDVEASVVVTRTLLASKFLQGDQLKVLLTDNLESEQVTPHGSVRTCCPSDLAYVMYTSGSTGRPKGVGISHLAATQSLLAHDDLIPQFKRFLQFASPTFDVSVFEVFFPLRRGATLVGADRESMLRDISHVITSMDVDAAELTPTVAGEFLRKRSAAPSLRVLLTIGEMLTRHVVDEFGQSTTREGILHGMYGPTEAAIHCTAATNFQVSSRVNLIGRPFRTVSACIVSLEGDNKSSAEGPEILPLGQIGELVIGGPQLAGGYINRPEENAKAFLEHSTYGRLYRTGDKARMLPNGEIECFGRISSGQVKLRGQRLELGEIENVICMAVSVRSTVAIVANGTLVAFVQGNDDGTDDEQVRQVCHRWLPRFMVPGEIIFVDKFPQLPSGKIDRKTLMSEFLRQRESTQPSGQQEFRDATEERIFSCVTKTLGTSVYSTDSLAATGLDSLRAVRLASYLRDDGFSLEVGKLLEADSVDNIWRLAKRSTAEEGESPDVESTWQAVVTAGLSKLSSIGLDAQIDGVEPCSHIQQAMIVETVRGSKAYCNWIELELHSLVEFSVFKDAFCKVCQQHSLLRSGFVEIGLQGHSYGRFTWNRLKDHVFQDCEMLTYDMDLKDEHGILHPLTVQHTVEDGKVRVLLHVHHALYDGWSWQLVLQDLRNALKGEPVKERPPYSNVTKFIMQFDMLQSAKDSYIYWQDQLYGMSPATWPNFNQRTDVPAGTGRVSRVLGVPVSKLNEVSMRLRIGRQAIFQAAFSYLLSSYLGTDDIVFGTVFSGRTLPVQGIESIIGPCIRTLPTRIKLDKIQTIADLLLALHNMNRKSLEHENLSLQDIKKASGIDINLSLFDSAIVWQETIWSEQQNETLLQEVASADFLEFAMMLELEPLGDTIHAKVTHQKSFLPAAQMDLFLEQIDHVVSVLIDSTHIPLGRVSHFLPSSVLSIENPDFETQVDLPSLAYSVEKLASAAPRRLAVEFVCSQDSETGIMNIESITYEQLNSRANRLANHLVHLGVGPDDLVGILMEKSIQIYISILAVIKAGAGYIPMTPQTPTQRVHTILVESNARVCITDYDTDHDLPALKSLQVIDSQHEDSKEYSDANIQTPNKGSDLAYAVFTSGSTGTPKGVLITHNNLQSNIAVLAELYPTSDESKMLQACSHAFDVSVFEIFFAWHTGMTLCSATNDIMFRDIENVIRSTNVTHLSLTPTVAALIDPKNVPGVQFLVTSGEGLTTKVHQDWAGRGLWQGYGPSETTNICTVRPNVDACDSIRNIGPPFKNTSAFVIADEDEFRLLPRGAVGEFSFGGDQVGRGYLNMPTLTAKKFIDHPQYGRLYRSGDFGRLLHDGALVFTGRQDDQVKLRGQRIELGEINSVLLCHEMVKDCASIIVDGDSQKQQKLVAFWVPMPPNNDLEDPCQQSSAIQDLFKTLITALPTYMVPSLLIPVDQIPMTTNKKTDHRKLKHHLQKLSLNELQICLPDSETADNEENLSDLEKTVAGVLAELTGTAPHEIGRHTSFYNLGLDSISAISFSRRLRNSGFGQLDVSAILRHSSVARLSAMISASVSGHEPDSVPTADINDVFDEGFVQRMKNDFAELGKSVEAIYPCTPSQEAMLSVHMSQGKSAYFNHLLFRIHGSLDEFRGVWDQMMNRHAILRTCFRETNHPRFAYAQIVLENPSLPWSVTNTCSSELDHEIEKQKHVFEEWSLDSDIPPYSLVVLRDSTENRNFLLLSIHHSLHDGEAVSQLLHEVQALLENRPLHEAVPFKRFIEVMLGVNDSASDAYWDEYLFGLSSGTLCKAKNMKGDASINAVQSHLDLNIALDSFKDQCKQLLVTPLNVFHASWARLLSLYTNSSDVCFGNVFSGRTIPLDGVDQIIGPCFNTLPVRIKLSSTATNSDVMALAQKSNSEILPRQLSSLRRIQRRILGDGLQLFDTLILLQNRNPDLDAKLWELVSEKGNMDFPMICEIIPDDKQNKIHICLHFQRPLVSDADAELIAQHFAALTNHTLRYPSAQASNKHSIEGAIPSFMKESNKSTNKPVSFVPPRVRSSQPWSAKEEEVRDILCQFSDVGKASISQDSTIFQLGLDSINAVQISARLQKIGHEVSAGDILEAATISNIASLLSSPDKVPTYEEVFDFAAFESNHIHAACERLQIQLDTIESLRPCTPVQNGMLATFSNSHGDMYFNRITWRPPAPLKKAMLRDAWSKVMAKHEMLRTGFVELQDKQHPFAMVTYRKEAAELPWYETSDAIGTSAPFRTPEDVLKDLCQPPWYLAVESSDLTSTIQFAALHAIYDAQSLNLILKDVAAALAGKSLSDAAPIQSTLGPILVEGLLQSDGAQNFWEDLGSEIQSSKFPDLHPSRTESRELLVSSTVCSETRKVLEDVCQRKGITLQATGQAAWARLLSAYTGEANVTFGVVFSGRNLSEAAQEAVFPCLVTIPSPCKIEGTNRELLSQIMKQNASLMKHQFTPLSKIQRWAKAEEGLFDTLFVYQKFSSSKDVSDEWQVVEEDAKIDYPVSIELIHSSTELEFRLTHRSDVVPREQAMHVLKQFDALLLDSIFSPDLSSCDFTSVGACLLSITPAKEEKIPCSVSLLNQFVEENAARIPSKAAFEFAYSITADNIQKKTWTYKEFNDQGNSIARLLQAKGAVPGGLIAISFDKCPEASLAILGILKAGCAYVAIDPNAPIARKRFIVKDSAAKLLLCTSKGKPELEGLLGVELVAMDQPGLLDGLASTEPVLERPIHPDDTCYCLYTSGTTGTPKGCEITHDNAVQAMLAFQRLFDGHWDEESRWLQFASFHFDVSVLEQYWSWSVGICVTSCPRDLLLEDLPGTIRRLEITHIDLTPSLARLVQPEDVPSLCRGVFITGGEQLKQEILDAWGRHGVIYNGYGPTEVTIGCTMLPRVPVNGKPSNIGPQFDNVGSYVLASGTSSPVLRGAIGELCVSGVLVGRGYLNRAELTKERFQVLEEFGERIYRTGDLVRILHDGSFKFLGRMDDQVKLRGQRLEIGEINETIRHSTSNLGEVTTLVIKHPKQSKEQLVSFVTLSSNQGKRDPVEVRLTTEDNSFLSTIKSACHAKLPGYMVPTHIVPMTCFPLSPNNKVDAKILRSIYEKLSLEELQNLTFMTTRSFSGTGDEQKVVAILAKFIGVAESDISQWSSIYELGLDSISVISFSRRLKDAGFVNAQPSLIMNNPSISGMASTLQSSKGLILSTSNLYGNAKQSIEAFARKHIHSITESLRLSSDAIDKIAPCTPLQEGMLYHFLNSDKPLYCSSFTFDLHESIDVSKLEKAWSETQNEVQLLRTLHSLTPDGYAQVVLDHCDLPWSLATVDSDEELGQLKDSKFKSWVSNINSSLNKLWEVSVIKSPSKSLMCLNIFHTLYDGNSLSLLLEKVAARYFEEDTISEGTPLFFDILPMGPLCRDPSAEQFWKSQLMSDTKGLFPKSNLEEHSSLVQVLDIDNTGHVDDLKKTLRVTEQAVIHACWLVTLHHHFSVVPSLGVVVSGRALDIPGVENVAGPLLNTIPSNIDVHGVKTWSDVVQRCHDYHTSTIPFQHTPLRDIMRWTSKTADKQLFDSLFVFQKSNIRDSKADKLWKFLDSQAEQEYPLAFEVVRNDNGSLTVTIAAQDHVMSLDTAQELLSKFQQFLHEVSKNPFKELHLTNGVQESAVTTNGTNGHENHKTSDILTNGHYSTFEWTSQAASMRGVIADLAGIDQESVGEDTSIFELGLDSIDAIKLSSRLGKLDIKLAVSAIMRHRTIRDMIEQLMAPKDVVQGNSNAQIVQLERRLTEFLKRDGQLPSDVCRVLPATPIQEAMVAEMVASNYEHYYNHDVLELKPHVDLARLEGAWRVLVRAHPILRTSFVEVWDPEIPVSYAQLVHNEHDVGFEIVVLDGESVNTIIQKHHANAVSSLSQRPMLAVSVAVDGEKRYLVLSIAHSLYDGWSINLLHEDVAKCYAGGDCPRPAYDGILEQVISSSGGNALKFWRATLANFIPTSFPRGQRAGNEQSVVYRQERSFCLPRIKFDNFCTRYGVTMQALSVSCWALVLAGYLKRLDVAFGLVLSGRNMTDSELAMFPTMNTVVMRAILHGSRSDMVRYIHGSLVDMSEHQHFPLRKVKSEVGSRPLLDTLFIYQKRPSESEVSGDTLYKSVDSSSAIEYPVSVEIEAAAENVVCRVACRQTVLGLHDTVELLDRMEKAISSIVQEPEQPTIEFVDGGLTVCGSPVFQNQTGIMAEDVISNAPLQDQTQWSPVESQVRKVLSMVSGIEEGKIKKEATLFHLGLDSISAIKVASLLKKQSISLTVSEMLRAGTIWQMALRADLKQVELTSQSLTAALDQLFDGIDTSALLKSAGIDQEQVAKLLPATSGQMYFLSMNAMNPEVFYPTFSYLATKELGRDVLDEAWNGLKTRLSMLRTAFVPTGQKNLPYMQVVMKAVENAVIWHRDVRDREAWISRKRDITSVPVALHACQTSRGTLVVLHLHHALYDAVSLPKTMELLAALCNGGEIQSQVDVDLSQLVAFETIHSPVKTRKRFWESYLGKNLNEDSVTDKDIFFGAIEHYYRPELVPNMSRIEAIAKQHNVSVQAVFLASYARVHARMVKFKKHQSTNGAGPERMVIGLYLANRSHAMEGLSDLIAPTVNIVPLRIHDKCDEGSIFAAAKRIQEELNEISRIEYSSVSLIDIAEWTGVTIDTCVNFLRFPEIEEMTSKADGNQEHVHFLRAHAENLEELAGRVDNDDSTDPVAINGVSHEPIPPALNGSLDHPVDARTIFKPTLDVEAAIRNDNLDLGVFGPRSRLGESLAESIINEIQDDMMKLTAVNGNTE